MFLELYNQEIAYAPEKSRVCYDKRTVAIATLLKMERTVAWLRSKNLWIT